MKFFKKYIILSVVVVVGICCNSHRNADKQIFYYNESRGVATLDPAFAKSQSVMWPIHQIYNTLISLDSNLNLKPSLAKHWTISNDRLTYTFYLRHDVFFQDNDAFKNGKGRQMKAQDVVYSLNRIMDAKTASTGAWIFNGHIASNGFKAVNDTVFQLRLTKPFHPILNILTMDYCAIVPKEVVQKYGKDFGRHPCGTGPFQLNYWEEGQVLVLKKNPQYWEKDGTGNRLPYLDAIKISFVNNKANEFLEFRQKQLSFINDIDPTFKDEVITKLGKLRKQWQGKIVLQKHPYLNTQYLGFLMDTTNVVLQNSPLKIKAVRQAINYAIDKKQMMMYFRNSIGTPATGGFVPNGFPSQNSTFVKGYSYNKQKALALLRKAGFANGQNLPALKLYTAPDYADLASFIAKQEASVGIKVQVAVVQKSMLLQLTSKSEAAFFLGSWIADYPDAENYMAVFYSKNPAPPNYTRYSNQLFDKMYKSVLTENDDAVRYKMYRQMDQIMIDDAPVVPLFYDEIIRLVQPNVKNFKTNALNVLSLKNTYIE